MRLLKLTLLIMLFALPSGLFGCNLSRSNVTDTDTDTDSASSEGLILVKDTEPLFQIIRPDDASDDQITLAVNIYETLFMLLGQSADITTDFLPKNATHDPQKIAILVGKTNYAESQEVYSELAYGDYGFRLVGNKVVIYGHTYETLLNATNAFIQWLTTSLTTDENGNKNLIMPEGTQVSGTSNFAISSIPPYKSGTLEGIYDAGDNSSLVYVSSTSAQEYEQYLLQLQESGFSLHTRNAIESNLFATYYNDTVIINAWYTAHSNEVRIVADTKGNLIPLSEEPTQKITSSSLTLISASNPAQGRGMIFTIRLNDGRFVVFDGGYGSDVGVRLYNELRAQAPDPNNIVIAAWFITHSHVDHTAAFLQIANDYGTKYAKTLKIEKIIYNFSSAEQASSHTQKLADSDNTLRSLTKRSFSSSLYYKPHPGNEFNFANMKVEVLGTHDSYYPPYPNLYNACCLFLKVTIENQVIIVTADTDPANLLSLQDTYGSYLKCDILQAVHHGGRGGGVSLNKIMNPSVVLFFNTQELLEPYLKQDYNKTLLSNPAYKEMFVSGHKITILPLPYTPGTAIIKD